MKIAFTGNVFPFGRRSYYGGERILGYLAEELANLGHEIYLFAPRGSVPPHGVKDFIEVDWMKDKEDVYLDAVKAYSRRRGIYFDWYQCNYFGAWDEEALTVAPYYSELVWNRWCHAGFQLKKDPFNVVSYSRLLQNLFLNIGMKTTMIHYGIPGDLYEFSNEHDNYAIWIGKIEGGKAPSLAIKLALAAGMKIIIMGPPYNTGCFWQEVAPFIDNKKVFWVRGVDDDMKGRIMRRAKVFISSNRNGWSEHAGIVNMESLACGTPILAFNRISDPSAIWTDNFIVDGEHGFFLHYTDSNNEEEVLEKGVPLLSKIDSIDRRACRKQFETKFTSELMAKRWDYFYNYIIINGNVDTIEIPF
jgi:glycosyltransferase involved in cell wall biosynthesis